MCPLTKSRLSRSLPLAIHACSHLILSTIWKGDTFIKTRRVKTGFSQTRHRNVFHTRALLMVCKGVHQTVFPVCLPPSLISLMVSVDVKHCVYFCLFGSHHLTWQFECWPPAPCCIIHNAFRRKNILMWNTDICSRTVRQIASKLPRSPDISGCL